jgi:membrane protein YqaA with SNARE-associated domain
LHWAHVTTGVKATLPALGGLGIFLSAFLDSSFVPLPLVTDLIVVDISSQNPLRMPYYAAMAAIGSVVGCIWIYALARKGGQAYYRSKRQQPSGRVRKWVQKYPFTSVLLPAVAPFPVPFKPFVIAQGVLQVPFISFVVGTFVGRGALFFIEGFLGVRYGATAREFVLHQKSASVLIFVALVAIFVAIRWFPIHRRNQQSPTV